MWKVWMMVSRTSKTVPKMTAQPEIPDIVVRRLPIYHRTLQGFLDEGHTSVSSSDLADRIGVTAAQIRRDLSNFGKFGKQGKGYDVRHLVQQIATILRIDTEWQVALCGFGRIGQAVTQYRGWEDSNLCIAAVFDADKTKIGMSVGVDDLIVQSPAEITRTVREKKISVGIVAVPAQGAQETTDLLVAGGVRAILNYAPVILRVREGVWVRDVDPVAAIQSMTYYIDPK
jgi:redox-sensing transcriptional repressor